MLRCTDELGRCFFQPTTEIWAAFAVKILGKLYMSNSILCHLINNEVKKFYFFPNNANEYSTSRMTSCVKSNSFASSKKTAKSFPMFLLAIVGVSVKLKYFKR